MEYEIHIWHDSQGRIVAWGHAGKGAITARPLAKPEHGVVTTRVAEKDLRKLEETHRVDPAAKRLIPQKTD